MARSNGVTQAWTLAVGTSSSVGLGVLFYFKTDLTTALASFAGLIGITITLQVDFLLRERAEREVATRQQRLMRGIEAVVWLPDLLDQAIGALTAIEDDYDGTMAVDLARRAFEACLAQLKDLRRGHYFSADGDPSPSSPVTELNERVQHSIMASNSAADLGWWLGTSFGRDEYWRSNQRALARGVKITRIFIYETWSAEMDALARTQHAEGVRVMRVAVDLLPRTLRDSFVVWDGRCSYQDRVNGAGEWLGQDFTFAPQDVDLMIDHFKNIESTAELWPPPPVAS